MSDIFSQDYLSQLNVQQREAVEYVDGPELVIAGAGSGKTRVLTYKIVHLLANGHNPWGILALTFTNKAASEMRERISALVGEETASQLWMGTFHSIFSRILRRFADRIGFSPNFTIYDASDSKSLIKAIIRELKLDDKVYRPGKVAADISFAKNNLYSPEDYARDKELMRSDVDAGRGRTQEIFAIYRDRCRIAGAMDFDDLLYYTNVLLRDNEDVRRYLNERFTYVLVDEYQDTNFAQHLIVRQLCQERQMLCVVGDDAQSIYSFRGANIRNIVEFERSFPQQRTFKLEQNYRSSRNIIGAANSLIEHNSYRIPKEVFSTNGEGERIEVVRSYNEYEEAYAVAARIAQVRMRYKLPLNEIAVLYRTNAQSRILEEALRTRNLVYRIIGGLAFYQRKEIKDAISYFRLAVNPHDDEAIRRVINTPKRGIGTTTIEKLVSAALAGRTSIYDVLCNPSHYSLDVKSNTLSKLNSFVSMINKFAELASSGVSAKRVANRIFTDTKILNEYLSDSTPENVSKRENLEELLNAVDNFDERHLRESEDSALGMAEFLAEVSLLTDQDMPGENDEAITLMTIHAAKGLEFECVFIVGAEEELFPSSMAKTSAEIEEERRLMYVAITRAKRFCMISQAARRTLNGQPSNRVPSRFISDIDRRFLRMVAGTEHKTTSRRMPSWREEPRYEPEPVSPRPQPVKTPVSKPDDGDFRKFTAKELADGMAVAHQVFGRGIIVRIDTESPDHRIAVRFDSDGEVRVLMLKFAKLKLL